MQVVLIAAMAENRVIGRDGGLPWHLPRDLARFKQVTTGHPVVMGRRTWESVGKPLPGRTNVVCTRQAGYEAPGAVVAGDLEAGLRAAAEAAGGPDVTVYVLGGGQLYAEALPRADALDLTIVHAEVDGDTRFPDVDLDSPASPWRLVADERHEADARNPIAMSFRRYERRAADAD